MLNTIYKFLTDEQECPDKGPHWLNIGFKQEDPCADIHPSCGMLCLLNLIGFKEQYPQTLSEIFDYSQNEEFGFPLVLKMIDFTKWIVSFMHNQKLYPVCNQYGDVFKGCQAAYSAFVIMFFTEYFGKRQKPIQMEILSISIEKELGYIPLLEVISPWVSLTDS